MQRARGLLAGMAGEIERAHEVALNNEAGATIFEKGMDIHCQRSSLAASPPRRSRPLALAWADRQTDANKLDCAASH